ncbi:Hypothetical predicted protein [Olea europaea subsp. europaea]|uniref:Uncharacterized protein n=1 Tax=Olea europaea subsp. europaea TaxID=158383 RepID=A0A8S0QN17_OLEEU|nr:Hypothetical predicted protein [Olea europaea subsp. europaea]
MNLQKHVICNPTKRSSRPKWKNVKTHSSLDDVNLYVDVDTMVKPMFLPLSVAVNAKPNNYGDADEMEAGNSNASGHFCIGDSMGNIYSSTSSFDLRVVLYSLCILYLGRLGSEFAGNL